MLCYVMLCYVKWNTNPMALTSEVNDIVQYINSSICCLSPTNQSIAVLENERNSVIEFRAAMSRMVNISSDTDYK